MWKDETEELDHWRILLATNDLRIWECVPKKNRITFCCAQKRNFVVPLNSSFSAAKKNTTALEYASFLPSWLWWPYGAYDLRFMIDTKVPKACEQTAQANHRMVISIQK